jgi:PAS domain S-box-containing protein
VDEADHELARKMGANALVLRTADLAHATAALEEGLRAVGSPPASVTDESVTALHRERLQVQLDRQAARNEALLRQAAIQATALSIIRGLSDVLAQPKDVTQILGDVLVHCLDAAGLSTGLLYVIEADGRHRLRAQFGIPAESKAHAEACFGHPELLHRIVEGRQPVAFSSDAEDADADARDFLARLGHSSVLIVPFVVLGESFGELVLAADSHDLSESTWTSFARTLGLQFGQTVALGQSLKRLAVSEGRYRALMEQANDAIFGLSTEGMILEANEQAEALLALPRDQMIGRHIGEFSPVAVSETPEKVRRFQEIVAAGRGRNDNVLLRRGDDTLVEVDFSVSVNEIAGEAYVVSIGRDVTERNQAAAALREAQQRLQHVVSSSPAVLYSSRLEGREFVGTWVSENIVRLLGYTPEEVLVPGWWDAQIHPGDRERVAGELAGFFAEGQLAHEYRVRDKTGNYRWIRAELRLLRDTSGRPAEAVGSWSDVGARKEAELSLLESEEQYRLLFDSNPHPMWVFDEETLGFLAVNDAAVRHYGWSRDEFLAMTIKDISDPAEVPLLLENVARSKRERQVMGLGTIGVWKHLKKDGSLIDVEGGVSPIAFQGHDAWLALATDITERRKLEAQLLQSQKMESVGRLAGGVAHDFNNLLGVITGYAELLQRRLPKDPKLEKYLDDILKAAHRAADLTRQLLAFSRRQVLQPRILDLNEVVAEMEKMLRRLIGEDVRLVMSLAAKLPSIQADAGQLEQVLMNLVVNARDAMPQGGRLVIETASLQLDAKSASIHAGMGPGSFAVLAVSDTGQGMSAEVRAQIFEPFFTTKAPGKGTGLGLATVHGIVKQSGGHVFVYSEPGRGSTFKVYLPTLEETPSAAPSRADLEPPRGTETVLVVEDEAALREFAVECLQSKGYTVLQAPNGVAAVELCMRFEGPIHLLLTDVVMPELGGSELTARLAVQRPDMRVLYMSGYTDDAVILHGVLTREMPFLEKPFTTASLARKVREVLDRG